MRVQPPGGERTTLALAQLVLGMLLVGRGALASLPWLLACGVALAGTSIALWFLLPWGRWAATAAWIGLGLVAVIAVETWVRWPGMICILFVGLQFWRAFSPLEVARHQAEQDEAEDEGDRPPMTSLVLLLRTKRALNARLLARYLEAAWGGSYTYADVGDDRPADPTAKGPDTPRFVVGTKPSFLISSPHGMFLVNCFDQPYFDEPEKLAHEVSELRLRRMLEENVAWISVDFMLPAPTDAERHTAYAPIASLVSELSAADCIALFCPETNQWLPWTDDLEEKLKEPNPLRLFTSEALMPVVEADEDDPRLQQAAAEARQRWPEFVAAFAGRTGAEGEHFGVKAPITCDGHTEFIWIEVTDIRADSVAGILGNNPVDLGALKLGSPVTVPVASIQDWAFITSGEPVGLFSVKVLQNIQSERSRSPAPNDS